MTWIPSKPEAGGGEPVIIKESLYVNVKDFGALGDGINNDAPAIQEALNSLVDSKRKVLFFPSGTYKCESGLKIPRRNISIVGETSGYGYTGMEASYFYDYGCVLKFIGTPDGTIGLDNAHDYWERYENGDAASYQSQWSNTTIENIAIHGNSTLSTGIRLTGANVLNGVTVSFCKDDGVVLWNGINQTHLNYCNISNNLGNGISLYAHENTGSTEQNPIFGNNQTTFSVFQSNIRENNVGVYMEVGEGSVFKNCVIESNKSYGLHINSRSTIYFKWLTFEDVWFESNAAQTGNSIETLITKSDSGGLPLAIFDRCKWSSTKATTNTAVKVEHCQGVLFRNIHTGHTNPFDFSSTAYNISFEGQRLFRKFGAPVDTGEISTKGSNTAELRPLLNTDPAGKRQGWKTDGSHWVTKDVFVDGKLNISPTGIGRTETLWFKSSGAGGANLSNVQLQPSGLDIYNHYPVLKNGFLVGIQVVYLGNVSAGQISIIPTIQNGVNGSVTATDVTDTQITINSATTGNQSKKFFTQSARSFTANNLIGVRFSTTEDFASSGGDLLVGLTIEY